MPVVCLVVLLTFSVINLKELPPIAGVTPLLEGLSRLPVLGSLLHMSVPVQIPLIAATAVASVVALRLGLTWTQIHDSFLHGIHLSMSAVLILLIVGMLIGTWIASGVVPLLIVKGLQLLSPSAFLVAACGICCVVSVVTGSSWTTAGTVGIALIGVGGGLGVPLPIAAGAIISGAYFGDKMSPLSDTTNLAPAIAGSDLFDHVRHMCWTTGPSLAIALLLYWILGLRYSHGHVDTGAVDAIIASVSSRFQLSGWLWLPPILVLGLIVAKVPALPSLLAGTVAGGVFAMAVQGTSLGDVCLYAYRGYSSNSGLKAVDDLLTRGGMSGMYDTVGIILAAMCFGGVMEKSGMLARIADGLLHLARGRGGLVAATLGTCIGMNIVASDQYLSIVVPGRMYRGAFARAKLHPKNLSRCLEDAGTLTSPLVPWNSCGAYMAATLGVFPLAYLPYAFLNLINPVVSAIYGYAGWTMAPAEPEGLTEGDNP